MKNFIKKPWGSEILIEHNRFYVLKKLTMKKNHQCSLQFHKKKKETIYILSGLLEISYGKKITNLKSKNFKPGESITLNPKIIHRMKAIKDSVYLEASTSQLKDVVRLIDDYRRV